MLLGLTGGYCAGKNEVAALLAQGGWACIDVDALGHEAMELASGAIVERFGAGILDPGGKLDRRALARIVFSDPGALADQEAIVHPLAIRLLDERIEEARAASLARGEEALICVNAALLHRTELIAACDAVIEVRAPLPVRVLRGMRRDRAGALAALRRILRQGDFPAALSKAAREAGRPIIVLRNAGSKTRLERSLAASLGRLRG
jgi:dephospho-CoA kinase